MAVAFAGARVVMFFWFEDYKQRQGHLSVEAEKPGF